MPPPNDYWKLELLLAFVISTFVISYSLTVLLENYFMISYSLTVLLENYFMISYGM